jgi:predicted dienelactone hydrolase
MEAFAHAGYLVLAPNHRDATCNGGEATWRGKPEQPLGQPGGWNDSTYRDRADDIRRLLDALRTDDRFRTRIDWNRVGLAGHSLGGYTVVGLAGGWSSWRLSGIKAVLALSPYAQPFTQHRTLSGLSVPVMYQGGTRDLGVTPSLQKSMGAYDLSPEPKYYVEFNRAGHFAWTNISPTAHESIAAYSLAFMNHYVKGDAASGLLTQKRSDVVVLRYQSELGRSGEERRSSRR